MTYRETDTVSAEAEANEAIDVAIEEASALTRATAERKAKRARVGRWFGRGCFLLSLVLFGLAASLKSHVLGMVAVAVLILSGGIGLMRLGGDLSVQAKGEQASVNRNIPGM